MRLLRLATAWLSPACNLQSPQFAEGFMTLDLILVKR